MKLTWPMLILLGATSINAVTLLPRSDNIPKLTKAYTRSDQDKIYPSCQKSTESVERRTQSDSVNMPNTKDTWRQHQSPPSKSSIDTEAESLDSDGSDMNEPQGLKVESDNISSRTTLTDGIDLSSEEANNPDQGSDNDKENSLHSIQIDGSKNPNISNDNSPTVLTDLSASSEIDRPESQVVHVDTQDSIASTSPDTQEHPESRAKIPEIMVENQNKAPENTKSMNTDDLIPASSSMHELYGGVSGHHDPLEAVSQPSLGAETLPPVASAEIARSESSNSGGASGHH